MPSSQRLAAFQSIQERPATATLPTAPLQDLWAQDVFDLAKMKAALETGEKVIYVY
jgi:glutamine synthetase